MISRCASIRNRRVVNFLAVVCAASSLAGTINADEVQAVPALPRPLSIPDEERIFRTLTNPTTIEFTELPLEDCLTFVAEFHGIQIRIDKAAVATAGVALDSPVTLKLTNVPFHRALDSILEPLGLDSYVAGPELVVTARAAAIDATRKRLEKIQDYEIQIIDHFCELTEMQKQKLQLAGRRDVERMLDGIQERREKILRIKNDETRISELTAEIGQLRKKIESGPFGGEALLRKELEKSLTVEQAITYEPIKGVLKSGGLVGTVERDHKVILAVLLFGDRITDENLTPLKRLETLDSLRLINTNVTDAGVAALQQAMPALKIEK